MVLAIIKPIIDAMPHDIFILILLGGIAYLVGVLFYINKKREFTHTIWHLFIILASFFHFLAIYKTSMNP
jgi:hemolysin III